MIEGRAVVDIGLVARARATLANVDFRPAWKSLTKPFRGELAEHRKRQEAPGGHWQPLASSTKLRRASGRRRRARKLLGRLPTAMTLKLERKRMVGRSKVAWSNVHRDGGTAGHGSRIPARDWLWVGDRFLKHAAEVIAKGIAFLIETS